MRRIALACTAITTAISGLAAVGWLFDVLIVTRVSPRYIPMAPSTALMFLVLSGVLFAHQSQPAHPRNWLYARVGVSVVLLVCVLVLIGFVTGVELDIGQLLLPDPPAFDQVPIGRMSPITAASFLLAGSSLLLLLNSLPDRFLARNIAAALATATVFVGLTTTLGYLYGAPLLYGGTIIPVALTTALAFLFLGTGLGAAAGPSAWPARALMGGSVRARLIRAFLPLTLAIILVDGGLYITVLSRASNPALAASLIGLLSLIVISMIVSRIALGVSNEIERARGESEQAQKALRESEERYRTVADYTYDWEYWRAPDGKILYMSPSCERITGYRAGEFIENPDLLDTIVHPDDHYLLEQHKSLVRQDGGEQRVHEADFRILQRDGEVRWIGHTCQAIRRADGTNLGRRATNRDITERKRAERALRQSEQKFYILFDQAAFAASLSRLPDGVIVEVNETFERAFGYTKQEVVGKTSMELGINPDSEGRARILAALKEQGSVRNLELTLRTKSGESRIYTVNVDLVDIGDQRYVLNTTQDITERKRAEEALGETLIRLERNNRELQDFAYVASHDLQEPLRKIQAFGDRLKSQAGDGLDEKGRDYLDRMHAAAGRMQTLISDLLAFSRVTTKAQPFAPTDLNQVTKGVLSDLEVRIEKSGGRVEVGHLPTIEADATQMRQMLQNLIANALKFHKPGMPPVVKVYLQTPEIPRTSQIKIVVADNGIGFAEKYLDRIFAPFQRLHPRGEYEGTGIGLAVVRKIVERHGGSVTARSAPGEGATFIVTLPGKQGKGESPS